jgi:hypothetical protein
VAARSCWFESGQGHQSTIRRQHRAARRRAWQRELDSAQNGIRSAEDELALAQSAQASLPERQLHMPKLISGLLGISLDETRAMYTERLDRLA